MNIGSIPSGVLFFYVHTLPFCQISLAVLPKSRIFVAKKTQ